MNYDEREQSGPCALAMQVGVQEYTPVEFILEITTPYPK